MKRVGLSLHFEPLYFNFAHLCPKSLIIKKKFGKNVLYTYFRTVQDWVNFVNLVILYSKQQKLLNQNIF